jgi:hypothetical protein
VAPLCWWCACLCRALAGAATRLLSCSIGAGRTASSRGVVRRVGLSLLGVIGGLSWHLPRPPIHSLTRMGTGAAVAWLVEGLGVMAMRCPASRVSASHRLGTLLGMCHAIFFMTCHVHSHLVTCAPMLVLTRWSKPPNSLISHGSFECHFTVGFATFPRA